LTNDYSALKAPPLKTCRLCGGPVRPAKVDLKSQQAGQTFVLEKVPVYVCHNCDEIWLPAAILSEFRSYSKLRSIKHERKR